MKKQLLITICLILLCCFSKAQVFEWAKGGVYTGANKMVRDRFGNFYLAGSFGLAKYDPVGNFIWQKSITGPYCEITGIATDTLTNIYLLGNFMTSATIDSYVLTATGSHANTFLVKFNSTGDVQWVTRSFSNRDAHPDGITTDKEGNPIIIGRFLDSLQLDSFTFKAPETNQIFLAKYSSSGVCLWAKHLVSESFNGGFNGPELKSDKFGNTYISGHFIGNLQFDSLTYSPTPLTQLIFLTKINEVGDFLWVKIINGSYNEESGPMDVDSIGNVYISGYFDAPGANFGSYALSTSSPTYFTAMYNSDGDCQWAKYGNAGIICATQNGYYTNSPGFVSQFNSLGNLRWTKSVPGAVNNAMVTINTDVYMTGSYIGPVNFDTCNLNASSNKIYIAKLSSPPIITSTKEVNVSGDLTAFPNPSNGSIMINVQSPLPKNECTLSIRNTLGESVYSEIIQVPSGSFAKEIDLSSFSKGVYFVELIPASLDKQTFKQVVKFILQ